MYRVTIYNDGTATIIHEISTDPADPHLYSCTLTQGSPGEIDSLEFSILPNNPGYDLLASRATLIEVYNSKTDKIEFSGRVLTITPEMQDSGLVFKSAVCESRLGYLCDSIQPYVEETTYTLEEFFDLLLENHNAQVEDYKKIYPGTVTAEADASTGNVTKGLNYQTTWSALSDKLLSTEGGEIELREGDDGLLYLDYVTELGEQIDTVTIEFGVNMRSISREIDPTEIITRLIPLGAKLEDSEGNETEERLTIASVNDDVIYLDDEISQGTYGIVVGTVEWDDVTLASNLLTKGTQWLQQQSMTDKISVTAYDLSLIGLADDAIERYNYYQVVNDAIGISRYYRVVKRTVDICDPSNITYEMGTRSSSLAATVVSAQKQAESEANERAAAISRLADKLASSSGLYMTTEEQDDGSYIYYMHNMPTLAESDIVWKLTAEAFGISLDGGQTYPYGFTVTGEMVMALVYAAGINADYINTGTLQVEDSDGNVMFSVNIDTGEVVINAATLTIKGTPTLVSSTIYYATSSSATEEPTGDWSQDQPTKASGVYIWSKTIYTNSNGTTSETDPVCISGLDGVDGEDGASVSISGTSVTYQASSSGTETPTGSWSDSVPDVSQGNYLWTRTITTYTLTASDGTTSTKTTTSYSVAYIGTDGADGDDGADGQMLYATCSTAAATAAKTATLSTGAMPTLKAGVTVAVTFTNANTAASPTLNVNSSGAKEIYVYGAALTASSMYNWVDGATVQFVYDGTRWVMTETSALYAVGQWCYANDKTYMNGAMIAAGTITAAKIYVTELSAICADVGTLTAGVIQSANYSDTAGLQIDLDNGTITSPYFELSSSGAEFTGKVKTVNGSYEGRMSGGSFRTYYDGELAGVITTVNGTHGRRYALAVTGTSYQGIGFYADPENDGAYNVYYRINVNDEYDSCSYRHQFWEAMQMNGAVTVSNTLTVSGLTTMSYYLSFDNGYGVMLNEKSVFRYDSEQIHLGTLDESLQIFANSVRFRGTNVTVDNGQGYYIRDTDGTARTAILLSDDNTYNIAVGSVANTVKIGTTSYTSAMYLRGTSIEFDGEVYATNAICFNGGTSEKEYLYFTTANSFIRTSGSSSSGYSMVLGNGYGSIISVGYASSTATRFYYDVTVVGTFTNSSDERLKQNIVAMSEDNRYSVMFDNLEAVTYEMIQTPGKVRSGFTTQGVIKAMEAAGLSRDEFAGVVDIPNDDGETYGALSYTDLIAPLVMEVQKLKKQVATLMAG